MLGQLAAEGEAVIVIDDARRVTDSWSPGLGLDNVVDHLLLRTAGPARPAAPPDPGMIPLTVPEISRLVAAALLRPSPPGHAGHWLDWRSSLLRRGELVSDRLVRFPGTSWQEIEALPQPLRWTIQRDESPLDCSFLERATGIEPA